MARDTGSGRIVALKYLSRTSNSQARALFKEEAALLSRLSHPNLVTIYDYEDTPEPRFAMEYVDGQTLAQAVSALDNARFSDILALFVQVCRGLQYIHARRILHRDLKPSNIMVTRKGVIKILDFGVARVATPAYTAPEARGGNYDLRSEFYSLGVLWKEVLRGRNLPPYFQEILDRLTSEDPNQRPASAAALIKMVNRHTESPFTLSPDEERETILDKPPWVPRREEKAFWSAIESCTGDGPRVIVITGPTGVGRTRFLEEMRWKLTLRGMAFEIFPDLHELPSEKISEIQLFLRRQARERSASLILLEYNSDFPSAALKDLLSGIASLSAATICLEDLSEEETRRLLRGALLEDKPEAKKEKEIIRASGGRPLLVLEDLRHSETIPRDLAQAARAKINELSQEAKTGLAFIVCHPEAPLTSLLETPAWTQLQSSGFLKEPSGDGRIHLRHPSLAAAYRDALPEQVREAHRDWIRILTQEALPNVPSHEAALIVRHALDAGDAATARAWSLHALDFLSSRGVWDVIENLCGRLGDIAESPMDRAIVHAHRAAVYYRKGRYEDAIGEYDRWYAAKPDDGTNVETVKHRLLTGRALAAWGKTEEAKRRLIECLASGDSKKNEHHRIFHAQAHLALAALESGVTGRKHLQKALALAAGHELLLGEIERCLGEQEQKDGQIATAMEHFRRAANHYRTAGNPQAQALAGNSIATALREAGKLKQALTEIDQAIKLAEAGGERLQIARYRENRALILMDLGLYGDAVSEREKARDALELFGTDLDRSLVKAHDGELDARLGRSPSLSRDDRPPPRLDDLQEALREIRELESPEMRADRYMRLAEACIGAELDRIALSLQNAASMELQGIRQKLPEELKMDFDKRPDLRALNESLETLAPKPASTRNRGDIPAARFRQFCAINRQIATKTDMVDILDRVIDAAIEITGAERGFVLLKDGKAGKSPLPGFEIKVARNLNRETLKTDAFELSLSLVKQSIDKSAYVLTDDAFSDPRFSDKRSIMDNRLRSILVVPLEEEGKVLGVIYLDHRYQPDCFSEEDLALVNALAAQASLAIQKARLIEELTRSRDKLAVEVKDQAEKLEAMEGELTKKRGELRYGYEEMIGQSPAMLKVFQVLDDVSETSIPVWIHGESGTGKELVARSLHVNSPRAKGPFVAENVSAIPETLLESELFGHKKGSFTHADRDRVGLFEQANGGTLFLDEVADMSLAMQAKLLRVLQEGEVRPVGAAKKIKIDVRLVTASNRDLEKMVAEGKFRQDLFFRINGLTVNLPALRNRKEDIPLLVRHFSKKVAREFNLPEAEVTDRALKSLMAHNWPGNVRELEAVLRNALLFAKGKPIGPDHLTIKASSSVVTSHNQAASSEFMAKKESKEDEAHRRLVLSTLRKHSLNKEEAAKELNVSLRTLYTWMEKHGIPKKKALLAQFAESV